MTKTTWLILGVVWLLFAGYCIALLYLTWPVSELSIAKSAMFGDSFGVLTALFSGLAFGGLILTLKLQREELGLQRLELKRTRQEIQTQNTENTFFQMVRLYNDIVATLTVNVGSEDEPKYLTGRDCLQEYSNRYKQQLRTTQNQAGNDAEPALVQTTYDYFWKESRTHLAHYFRFIERLFMYSENMRTEDRLLYTELFVSQMSDQEQTLLFYHGLSDAGVQLRGIIERNGLLELIDQSDLVNTEHRRLYANPVGGASL